MILVPELETVVILVPRTGSGALRRAIADRYPYSMQIYRHMEADGVPAGYDRWRKVAVVRHPLDRLWSLYKFLRAFNLTIGHDQAYVDAMLRQVDRPFDDWLLHNETPFTTPYDSAGLGRFWPQFTVRHPLPENRKSQFVYVRPDLGTQIMRYDDIAAVERHFDLSLPWHNTTTPTPPPALSPAARDHMHRWFSWDYSAIHAREVA